MFGMIRCFERKLSTFQRDLESGAFKYFPRVKLLFNEASRENIEQHVAQFVEFLKSVIDQFSSIFLQFRQVEKTIKLIKYPDEIEFTDLKLDEFEWLDLKDLIIIIVYHILTQAAIWTTVTGHLSRRQGGSVLWASFPSSFADKSDMSLSDVLWLFSLR